MHPLIVLSILIVAIWIAVSVASGMGGGSAFEDCLKQAAVDPSLSVSDCS